MKSLKIILRTCTAVKNVGSSQRPFNLDKKTIILKCLKSLLECCSQLKRRNITLEIVDDSSGANFINLMKRILSKYKITYNIHLKNFKNNGKSMEYCYNLAERSKADLIYFLEDDYFHLKHSILAILDAYESKLLFTDNFAIFPTDYPRLYHNIEPSLIFIGKYCHWRSTPYTTGTFVIPKKLFLKYKELFYKFARFNRFKHGGEKETINILWKKKIPCISPIPSLTAHLHKTSIPPLIDWKKELKID